MLFKSWIIRKIDLLCTLFIVHCTESRDWFFTLQICYISRWVFQNYIVAPFNNRKGWSVTQMTKNYLTWTSNFYQFSFLAFSVPINRYFVNLIINVLFCYILCSFFHLLASCFTLYTAPKLRIKSHCYIYTFSLSSLQADYSHWLSIAFLISWFYIVPNANTKETSTSLL